MPYAAQLNTPAYSQKIKTVLAIPQFTLRAQVAVCQSFTADYPCPLNIKFPRPDPSVTYGYFGIAGQVFVKSPPGVSPQYGVLPVTRVQTLAFGSIPISATVQLRQVTGPDGFARPLTLSWFTTGASVTAGAYIPGYEQYGPAPPPSTGQTFWNPPPIITGPVTITITDIQVDRKKLTLSTPCTSSAVLHLTARGGFYQSTGIAPGEGQPGEYSPLSPQGDSYLHGYAQIPAFVGCKTTSGDDLSPLVSNFVSGDQTLLTAVQHGPLVPFCTARPDDQTCPKPTTAPTRQRYADGLTQLRALLQNRQLEAR